jgi:hypothetical protein
MTTPLHIDGSWLTTTGQLAIELATVDGWFHEFISAIEKPAQWERSQLTLGSVQYLVAAGAERSAHTWRYTFRQLTAQTTHYDVATNGGQPSLDDARELFTAFSQWHRQATGGDLGELEQRPMASAEETHTLQLPARPEPDADVTVHNEWAFQALGAGRDRHKVFREWLKRRRLNPSTPEEVRRVRDLFNKAMRRRHRRAKP